MPAYDLVPCDAGNRPLSGNVTVVVRQDTSGLVDPVDIVSARRGDAGKFASMKYTLYIPSP